MPAAAGVERNVVALDRQIDQLVYDLYGLTEIRIVEEATEGAGAKD